jgi:hypothetical protein
VIIRNAIALIKDTLHRFIVVCFRPLAKWLIIFQTIRREDPGLDGRCLLWLTPRTAVGVDFQ